MKKLFCKLNRKVEGIIYCNKENVTGEDIIRLIPSEFFVGKFVKEEYEYPDTNPVKNDDNLYITEYNKILNVWQVRGKLSDMTGIIIPNVYKVRLVGYIIEEE